MVGLGISSSMGPSELGLPDGVRGCLFDMDGVLTKTATVHARAWKQMFDRFLEHWAAAQGVSEAPFDVDVDYDRYVDGRSREDGTRTFLHSRGIDLPDGDDSDPPGAFTVAGLSAEKNALVLELLSRTPVETFYDSMLYVRRAAEAGVPRAVVSASANTAQVLESAGIGELFDARIDGVVAAERKLPGKPAPDMFLAGAEALGLRPDEAAVFEDAQAGVAAGRAGHFGFVVGVDRAGQGDALRDAGADVVVTDLRQLLVG